MKNIIHTLFLVFLSFMAQTVKAQTWDWAHKAGAAGNEYAGGIDVDNTGNSYVTGLFYNTITFGAFTLTHAGWTVYIAKYDASGSFIWAKSVASATQVSPTGISVDKSGYITIVGQYADTATFDATAPVALISTGDFDIFIASFTAAGDLRWAKSTGGLGFDYCAGIGKDAMGNCYISGEFHYSSFSGSSSKVFVAKYDNLGNNLWTIREKDWGNFHQGNGISTDTLGNSYITGQFFYSFTFDSTIILDATTNPEANIFLGKIDSDGKVLWLQKAGAPSGYAAGTAIDIDPQGNAYITGFYRGTISFSSSVTLSGKTTLAYDAFVAKYTTNGNFDWVSKTDGPGPLDGGICITIGNTGACYVAGHFTQNINFGSTSLAPKLTAKGGQDIFVSKMDTAGNFVWATNCGSLLDDDLVGIKSAGNGIYLTGNFFDTMTFGSSAIALMAKGANTDIFISRLGIDEAVTNVSKTASDITIFPDPAVNSIQLKGIDDIKSYAIYTIDGRLVQEGSISPTGSIQLASTPLGKYFMRLWDKQSGTKSSTLSFIKR